MIVPRVDSTFCGQIAQGIQEACIESDYRVLLAHTLHRSEVEARQVDLLLEHRVDGLICVADEWTIGDLPRRVQGVLDEHVPCVVVDDRSLADRVDCVVSDDDRGARLAVRHLLALGHRRVAHLGAGPWTSPARDRDAAYRAALHEAGLEVDEALIAGQSFSMHRAAEPMKALLDLPRPPTAVFAANDRMAAEAILAIERRGLRVPEDVAIVGYSDMEMSQYLELTTVHQDTLQMGASRSVASCCGSPSRGSRPGRSSCPPGWSSAGRAAPACCTDPPTGIGTGSVEREVEGLRSARRHLGLQGGLLVVLLRDLLLCARVGLVRIGHLVEAGV